ncbi:unnamed protein product [Amoebophrya sp. A120]|nr:unnamed protein product [Amoebophrya sp. A120]|eukprot:GSA120T00013219001.1
MDALPREAQEDVTEWLRLNEAQKLLEKLAELTGDELQKERAELTKEEADMVTGTYFQIEDLTPAFVKNRLEQIEDGKEAIEARTTLPPGITWGNLPETWGPSLQRSRLGDIRMNGDRPEEAAPLTEEQELQMGASRVAGKPKEKVLVLCATAGSIGRRTHYQDFLLPFNVSPDLDPTYIVAGGDTEMMGSRLEDEEDFKRLRRQLDSPIHVSSLRADTIEEEMRDTNCWGAPDGYAAIVNEYCSYNQWGGAYMTDAITQAIFRQCLEPGGSHYESMVGQPFLSEEAALKKVLEACVPEAKQADSAASGTTSAGAAVEVESRPGVREGQKIARVTKSAAGTVPPSFLFVSGVARHFLEPTRERGSTTTSDENTAPGNEKILTVVTVGADGETEPTPAQSTTSSSVDHHEQAVDSTTASSAASETGPPGEAVVARETAPAGGDGATGTTVFLEREAAAGAMSKARQAEVKIKYLRHGRKNVEVAIDKENGKRFFRVNPVLNAYWEAFSLSGHDQVCPIKKQPAGAARPVIEAPGASASSAVEGAPAASSAPNEASSLRCVEEVLQWVHENVSGIIWTREKSDQENPFLTSPLHSDLMNPLSQLRTACDEKITELKKTATESDSRWANVKARTQFLFAPAYATNRYVVLPLLKDALELCDTLASEELKRLTDEETINQKKMHPLLRTFNDIKGNVFKKRKTR